MYQFQAHCSTLAQGRQICLRYGVAFLLTTTTPWSRAVTRLPASQFMEMEAKTAASLAARELEENEKKSTEYEQERKDIIAEHTEKLRVLVEGWVACGLMRNAAPPGEGALAS